MSDIRGGVAWPPGTEWGGEDCYSKIISNGFVITRASSHFIKEVLNRRNQILKLKAHEVLVWLKF